MTIKILAIVRHMERDRESQKSNLVVFGGPVSTDSLFFKHTVICPDLKYFLVTRCPLLTKERDVVGVNDLQRIVLAHAP